MRRRLRIRNYDRMRNNNPMREVTHRQASERLGEVVVNCQGEEMEIIEYRAATDIDILFRETGNVIRHQHYANFKKGALKDYHLPTFYGHGIRKNGRIFDDNGRRTNAFAHWDDMLKRCYYEPDIEKHPAYSDCHVCDEWLDFTNFEAWVDNNFYRCGDEKWSSIKIYYLKAIKYIRRILRFSCRKESTVYSRNQIV